MKSFFSVLFLTVAFSFCAQAQGLSFNRVVSLKGIVSVNNTYETVATVPAGKVWKIENVSLESSLFWYQEVSAGEYILTGIGSTRYMSPPGSTGTDKISNAVWYGEGEQVILRTSSQPKKYAYSIIEFNVN